MSLIHYRGLADQPATEHRSTADPTWADTVWEPGAALLSHSAAVLEWDPAGAAAEETPPAPTPAGGGHTAHTHMEAAAGQVSTVYNW